MSKEILNHPDTAKDFANHFRAQTSMEFKPITQIEYSNSPAVRDIMSILERSELTVEKFSNAVKKDSQFIQKISDALEMTDANEAKKYGE